MKRGVQGIIPKEINYFDPLKQCRNKLEIQLMFLIVRKLFEIPEFRNEFIEEGCTVDEDVVPDRVVVFTAETLMQIFAHSSFHLGIEGWR